MTADYWEPSGEALFAQQKGIPGGVLELKTGSAVLTGLSFSNGTIEFDTKLVGKGIVGIRFRRQDKANADVLYLRPQPDCPRSNDCMQYMPQSHGSFEWDLFPEYQTAAPIVSDGWNHIKMVVMGKRMLVYVDGRAAPTLTVAHLEGDALEGTISFHGPATFANLVVTPDEHGREPLKASPDPTAADPNYVRTWLVSRPLVLPSHIDPAFDGPTGDAVTYRRMPGDDQAWTPIRAERKGLVNLTHAIGSNSSGAVISTVWAKTGIDAKRAQTVHVAVGWAREIWVFLNGNLVYADRNLYAAPSVMKQPDARVALQNGGFDLPLIEGRNHLVVAINDNFPGGNHFKWGFMMRLETIKGLKTEHGL